MPSARSPLLLVAAFGLSLSACGARAPAQRWISLADGFEPAPAARLIALWREAPELQGAELSAAEDGRILLRVALPRSAWIPDPETTGRFCARSPYLGDSRGPSSLVLEADGEPLHEIARPYAQIEPSDEALGTGFYKDRDALRLTLAPDVALPARFALSIGLERGHARDGRWRAVVGPVAGDGLAVWSGEEARRDVELAPGSVLRFVTAAEPVRAGGGPTIFTVRRDGRTLLRHEQDPGEPHRAHEVPLEGAGTARLVFAVEGPPAVAAFLAPTVGPALVERADGVVPDRRPDVVLFVLDTFRADNLAAYGGDPTVAPRLNAFARRCARFVDAHSTSTWTLPAHASLFTATLPLQHGANDPSRRLPSELPTLAEELAARGYRTGAVTDSAFVSRAYGLDEGFEWFEEYAADRDLGRTLGAASEFLARDDGRPVFLFVQTYRSHTPYRTGSEEDRSLWQALVDEYFAALEADPRAAAGALAGLADRFEALYRDGARALDARLGAWLEHLEERRYFDRGYALLTSDHGEAFFEHGKCLHGGKPYGELLRVPLLLRGPDVASRDVEYGVSLVDVPRTVADLVGFAPPDAWTGTSLLALDAERPVLAMTMDGGTPWIAVVEGDRKILAELDVESLQLGECEHAFDLARDPDEARDLADGPAPWPDELCQRVAPLVDALTAAMAADADVEMTEALRRQLAELGYAGE